jgi:hypothetical protein
MTRAWRCTNVEGKNSGKKKKCVFFFSFAASSRCWERPVLARFAKIDDR